MISRQVTRRNNVIECSIKYHGASVPKDLFPRKERRKLARANAARLWRERA